MKLSIKLFMVVMFSIVFIFSFAPIVPSEWCPPIAEYCNELQGDRFSMFEYMQVASLP